MAIFCKIQYYSVFECSCTVDLHNVVAPKLKLHDPKSESYALALASTCQPKTDRKS